MQVPTYAYALLAVAWLLWMAPFFLAQRRRGPRAVTVDSRARWGMLLQGIAYALLWQSQFWLHPPEAWRQALAVLFSALAITLSWSSVRTLGRQWRVDAGLNADHQLVRSGPYSLVRHPIYSSMLCQLLSTGFLLTPLPLLALATVIFIGGTEIRVHPEEKLLASRFGEEFLTYRGTVAAYIPLIGNGPSGRKGKEKGTKS